jgi:histidine kinase/DNA gyrase B/HSP90-like ATPase
VVPSIASEGACLDGLDCHAVVMVRVHLQAAADLIERLAHEREPLKAVVELIWNALDADAHLVEVEFERNELEGVEKVVVQDDGHGIPHELCRDEFGRIGGSWKKNALRSQTENRPLHGKTGQGRLRAFALGIQVRWTTTAKTTAGEFKTTVISGSASHMTEFDISDALPADGPAGTVFEGWGKQTPNLAKLLTEDAPVGVGAALAPYLLAHGGVEIWYDGQQIDPRKNISNEIERILNFEHEGQHDSAHLRIIEWKAGHEQQVYLCDANQVPVDEYDHGIEYPDFRYSVYVSWSRMPEYRGQYLLRDMAGTPLSALSHAVSKAVRSHFDERRTQRRRELVQRWKDQDVYPYEGEPADEPERVERATFDVVATSISRHIPKDKNSSGLTLSLLKGSLRHNPGDVQRVLDQVLSLPKKEKEQLGRLLDRTSLSHIIRASSNAADRLDFLAALDRLVFHPETSKLVKERDHLHKILERELWIFGEEYNMMTSERTLSSVLDRHLALLGRDRTDTTQVRRLDGSTGRIDLLLSAAASEFDRNRHLVVELKAPSVVATHKELRQIRGYAKAVTNDPRFADAETVWDFWLIVTKMDDDVLEEARQENKPDGLVHEPRTNGGRAKVKVWVRTWGEILRTCEQRLQYFKNNLQHDPSVGHALEYLNREHGELVSGVLDTKSATTENRVDATGNAGKPLA